MATSSYLTDVFPQPSNYRPDFNFIDVMLRRRQALYNQGFSQIADRYRFVNRETTNPIHTQQKEQFLSQARENLKNLSAMDLSQMQNVSAASQVFEPFAKNTNILGDMALTSHWNQQESIAESLRLKDGGKDFSEDNLQYVRKQRMAYAMDAPESWKSYYGNRRSYTPYYDWNKEFKEWFSSYKPDKLSIERRAGLYNITEEKSGATSEDLKLFFSSVASEKAKNQMRIEAAVRIGDNVEQVLPFYTRAVEKDINTLQGELRSIDNKVSLTKNSQEKTQLGNLRKQYQDKIDDLNQDLESIKKGDVGFVKSNAERIAFSLYFDEAVNNLAKGLSWQEYKRGISGDDVAMMKYREAETWRRLVYSENRQDARKRMEIEGIPGQVQQVSLPSDFSNVDGKNNIQSINTELQGLQSQNAQLAGLMRNHVAAQLGKKPSEITDRDYNDYIKSDRAKADPQYQNYKRAIGSIILKEDMLKNQIASAESYANQKVFGPSVNNLSSDFQNFIRGKSILGISPKEMHDAVLKGTAKMVQRRDEAGKPISGLYDITVNGRTVSGSKSLFGDDPIVNLYEKAVDMTGKSGQKRYQEALNEYFGNNILSGKKGFVVNEKDKRSVFTRGQISPLAGLDPTNIQGLIYGGNNDAYFTVSSEAMKKDATKESANIVNALTSLGIEAKYDAKINRFYIKEKPGFSTLNLGLDVFNSYTPLEKGLIQFGQNEAGHEYQSPHFYPNDRATDKYGNPIPQFYYKVLTSGMDKMYYLYNDQSGGKPIISRSSITDLIDIAKSAAERYYELGLNVTFKSE